jgi:hypothetical protein
LKRFRRPAPDEKLKFQRVGFRVSVVDVVKQFAQDQRWSFSQAAATLVEEALERRGYFGDVLEREHSSVRRDYNVINDRPPSAARSRPSRS